MENFWPWGEDFLYILPLWNKITRTHTHTHTKGTVILQPCSSFWGKSKGETMEHRGGHRGFHWSAKWNGFQCLVGQGLEIPRAKLNSFHFHIFLNEEGAILTAGSRSWPTLSHFILSTLVSAMVKTSTLPWHVWGRSMCSVVQQLWVYSVITITYTINPLTA